MTPPSSGEPAAESLDPTDWEEFRTLCHRAVDDMVDHWRAVRERPVWQPIPDAAKRAFGGEPPWEGRPAEAVYDSFRRTILPHLLGNTHPHFWGWVHGSGTPIGALAEFLAGAVNANLGGREHMPVHVERDVVRCFVNVFGLPEQSSGLLVSGSSMATLLGLAVARQRAAPKTIRGRGVIQSEAALVGYCSAQAHNSVKKAFELLGLGADQLRRVACDAADRIDLEALERAIRADRTAGLRPFAVVASAGTVNTGAFDDLRGMRAIADRHELWLHVDGAFGGLAVLVPALAHLVDGIETADSLAFDFHKWLHVPYDAGCVLVRDGALHMETFGGRVAYLTSTEVGAASGEPWFCDYGVELSRGFRALKVWFTIQHYGLRRLGRAIERNCAQARHLARRIEREPGLELAGPVPLNIVCFRPAGTGNRPPDEEAQLTARIITQLQVRGIAVPSSTTIAGRQAIRVCITNHRTTEADLDAFVDQVLALADELAPAAGG